jgi:tetratricopeptide (TPR) repeat protein
MRIAFNQAAAGNIKGKYYLCVQSKFSFVRLKFFLQITLSFFIWLGAIDVCSQAASQTFSFRQKVAFAPNPGPEEMITNDLLQHIAEGSGRLRSMVSYEISGNITAKVETGNNGRQTVSLIIENLLVNGDMQYRDFSIGQVLIPDLLRLELIINSPNGTTIRSEKLSGLKANETGVLLHKLELPKQNGSNGVTVFVRNIHLSYSNATYERLNQWFGFLEEYYATGPELRALHNEIFNISFADPSTMVLNEFELCEAERKMALHSQRAFLKALDPSMGDPEGVFLQYAENLKKISLLRFTFNERLAIVDSLLVMAGRSFAEKNQWAQARERFENSLVFNPVYVPAHLALAELDLRHGNKKEAINRIGDVYNKMFPSAYWERRAKILTDSVLAHFFQEAFELHREGRFKESLDMLAPLESFCNQTLGFFQCPQEVAFRLNQAHLGMYRSFLVVGNRAFRNENLDLCLIYTQSAVEYQQNNSAYIPDGREAFDLLQMVVNKHIERAVLQFSESRYALSAQSYQAATDLCEKYSGLFCPPNLQRRQQLALDMSERREVIAPPGQTLLPEPEPIVLPPFIGQPRQELIERIQLGQLKAWAGDVEAARKIESDVKSLSQRFKLNDDRVVISEIQKLRNQIALKECELAGRELDALVKRGINYRTYGEIGRAAETARNALALIEKHPDCSLSASDELKALLKLQSTSVYLSLVEEAQKNYYSADAKDFSVTLEKYHEAELFLQQNNPEGIDATQYRMVSFASGTGDVSFIKESIAFMAGHPSVYETEVIDLLSVLKAAGLSRNETRALQDLAGRKLGVYFRVKMAGQSPENVANTLTGGDSWFRFFNQAFIRYWSVY